MSRSSIPESVHNLMQAGIDRFDAEALRRIAMTLHRWRELECGGSGHAAIERDEKTGIPYWYPANRPRQFGGIAIPDRETGALKRLAKIMKLYPTLRYYVQGDPRGASLYILRPGDAYYSRGIAVYK